jgi:hypothetical protein
MILPFSGMNFAEADKNTIRTDMKSIHDAARTAEGSEKETLIAEYKLKNQEFNDSIHKTPERDFVAEWQVLETEFMSITDKQSAAEKDLGSLKKLDNSIDQKTAKQAEINSLSSKAQELRSQIDDLQSESVAFMKMNPDDEEKYKKIVSNLHAKYENTVNGFVAGGIDYEQKKMIVELTNEFDDSVEFENSSVAIAEEIRSLVGENNVIITFDTMNLVSCTNYLSTCTPRVGGVAIARYDATTDLAGSIGYKATKSGNTGYVTAGHVVDFYNTGNRKMIQAPGTGNLISDGTNFPFTKSASSGDVSFQKTSVSINDDIYYSSNTKIDVASYATASSQHSGQFVYKMGAGNGLTWGYVNAHLTSIDTWRATAQSVTGDSGGTIFQITGSSGGQYYGKVFGHVYAGGGDVWYQPTEKIIANHGIYPATT